MCVDFTYVLVYFWGLCCFWIWVYNCFESSHHFDLKLRKNQGPSPARLVLGSFWSYYPGPPPPGARQPDCVTTNCVPNSHRELNQPPPSPRKRKKNILNHPFYKLILNHPFYRIILNHPFFFLSWTWLLPWLFWPTVTLTLRWFICCWFTKITPKKSSFCWESRWLQSKLVF